MADVGIFTSTDPDKQFWSLYAYSSNPLAFIDPNGMRFVGAAKIVYDEARKNNFWGNNDLKWTLRKPHWNPKRWDLHFKSKGLDGAATFSQDGQIEFGNSYEDANGVHGEVFTPAIETAVENSAFQKIGATFTKLAAIIMGHEVVHMKNKNPSHEFEEMQKYDKNVQQKELPNPNDVDWNE